MHILRDLNILNFRNDTEYGTYAWMGMCMCMSNTIPLRKFRVQSKRCIGWGSRKKTPKM